MVYAPRPWFTHPVLSSRFTHPTVVYAPDPWFTHLGISLWSTHRAFGLRTNANIWFTHDTCGLRTHLQFTHCTFGLCTLTPFLVYAPPPFTWFMQSIYPASDCIPIYGQCTYSFFTSRGLSPCLSILILCSQYHAISILHTKRTWPSQVSILRLPMPFNFRKGYLQNLPKRLPLRASQVESVPSGAPA